MWVVFERENGRVRFEVLRGAERDERILRKLFQRYGREICREVPLGTPINLDVYKLKKIYESRKKRNRQRQKEYSRI